MATRRVARPITKKSEAEIRKAVQDWKTRFGDWDLTDVEVKNKTVNGQSVPHIVLVLKG